MCGQWKSLLKEKGGGGGGKWKEGETVLTNTKIIKQNIKAREAQNHNRSARTTPSHLSSLVEHNFSHL
jgi:hypothetical protein